MTSFKWFEQGYKPPAPPVFPSEYGLLSAGGNNVGNISGQALVEVIPEPASLALLALGGLAAIRRRR